MRRRAGRRGGTWARTCLAVVAVLFCSACFEPPVSETLLLRFLATGQLEVLAATRIRPEKGAEPLVLKRVQEARAAALSGEDSWSRSIRSLSPVRESVTFSWDQGELRRVERSAAFLDPNVVTRLFSDLPVNAFVKVSGLEQTFEIHPARTLRADARQRQVVREAVDRFARLASIYYGATSALWRFLEEHPERATDVLARVFNVDPGAGEAKPTYSPAELELVERLEDAMDGLTSVLHTTQEEAFTLDELSRLVYDPLPAALTVEVPAPVVDAAGFRPLEGNRWAAPSVGLWGALNALKERWVRPEPFRVIADEDGRSRPKMTDADLEAFAALPREIRSVPGPDEVRAALEAGLSPPETYRLTWQMPPGRADGAAKP